MTSLKGIDVAILAGGLGTRVRGVLGDTPKVLAPINGRPYLDHLLDWLAKFNVERVVMCLGHQAQKVEDHLAKHHPQIECIIEDAPLGTGGAIQNCRHLLKTSSILIMNGDTWLETDLGEFVAAHQRDAQDISIICVAVEDVSRYGKLQVNKGVVTEFCEKDTNDTGFGFINGGVYLMSQAALGLLCETPIFSLENDFFQKLPPESIHAFIPDEANFIDIGTPETLVAANSILPVQ